VRDSWVSDILRRGTGARAWRCGPQLGPDHPRTRALSAALVRAHPPWVLVPTLGSHVRERATGGHHGWAWTR
jgi:hypothetical protein